MLTKYVSGKLSPAEKHGVERHLADCEMCSDAVEGLGMIADKNKLTRITAELNQKIQSRAQKKEGKVIFLQQYRAQLAVAASVVVLLGLVWFFRSNMSMKELSPESSEKIFADKFEPYQEDDQATVNTPAAESPVPVREEQKFYEKEERTSLTPREDKKAEDKVLTISDPVTKEGAKGEEVFYHATEPEKQAVAAPVTSVPAGDIVLKEEIAMNDRSDRAGKAQPAQKSAEPASAIAQSTSTTKGVLKKDKELTNRNLEEDEKNQQSVQLIALQTKSESGKKRNKTKEKKTSEEDLKRQEENLESRPVEVSGNVATGATTATLSADSVSAELSSTSQMNETDVGMQKYQQKDYAGAAMDFETTLKNEPDNYNALFYSAVSYLSTGETDKAIVNLNKVLLKKDGELYDAAQWYLSLAYIKKNDTESARKNLIELQQNSKSRYQKQADETLKQIRK